ncbi:MAG: ribonuclease HI [Christensenellales bacterium]|jgi:ribonuclease HI
MVPVTIYTDGACSGNPGPGGWAAVLIYGEYRKEISGYEPLTTNNRMELTAAIKALQALNRPCEVELYTDSAYLSNAFLNGWIDSWMKNGWKKADRKPVENADLWRELARLSKIHSVRWHKVKGHSDNALNNLCDKLATGQIKANS